MSNFPEEYAYIRENLAAVRERLAAAAARGGSPVPQLIAVTKSATDEEVSALLDLGIEAIAENRAQLFRARADLIEAHRFPEGQTPPKIHLIGSLQTNKVKYVVGRAAMIQSLDSQRLAEALEAQACKRGVTVPVLIEVNSGRGEQKGGLMPEEVEAFAEALAAYPHLTAVGLMTMGPDCEEPEGYRPYFRLVRELAETLAARGLLPTPPVLSMGMSGSYEIAAEEGATHVRVGRSLFHRPEVNE